MVDDDAPANGEPRRMPVETLMGSFFQLWGQGITMYAGCRQHLERNVGAGLKEGDISFWTEVEGQRIVRNAAHPHRRRIRLDYLFEAGPRRTCMIGEAKWTRHAPLPICKTAIAYLEEATLEGKTVTDRLLVVGSAHRRLDARALTAHLKLQGYEDVWAFQNEPGGTAVLHYLSPALGPLTVVAVVTGEGEAAATQECAVAVAILLTQPRTGERPPEQADQELRRLATSCIEPGLRRLITFVQRAQGALSHPFAPAEMYPSGFILDPWSCLLQQFVDQQRRNNLERHSWVQLLHGAVTSAARGNDNFLTTAGQLADRIAPLALRCGSKRNVDVVRELAHSIPRSRAGGHATAIRIVCGPSGTGKTTLMQYLYNTEIEQLWRGGAAGYRAGIPVYIDLQTHAQHITLPPDGADVDANNAHWITILERLAGAGAIAFWAEVAGFQQRHGLDASILAALFTRFRISLYVDGYDQLQPAAALGDLGLWMKGMGCEFGYVLLSSRPGHSETSAFEWTKTFDVADAPDVSSVLALARPDKTDVDAYCEAWLQLLAPLLRRPGSSGAALPAPDALTAKAYSTWLKQAQEPGGADDASPEAIEANPLLLAVALSIYIHQLFGHRHHPLRIRVRSDLYRALLEDLEDRSGAEALGNADWRPGLALIAFASLRRPGRSVGHLDAATLRALAPTAPGTRQRSFIQALQVLPLVQTARLDAPAEAGIDFVHPSFHEYLAADYLAAQCEAGSNIRLGDGDYDQARLVALRIERGAVTTLLGDLIVSMGRDAFKFVLGCLLAYRPTGGVGTVSGLQRFFNLLDADYGLQQYLYDAGYVDAAFAELKLVETELPEGSAARRCVNKLIGHKFYGTDGRLPEGIAYLFEIATQRRAGNTDLDRWYRLFCVDHIDNRMARFADPATLRPFLENRLNDARNNELDRHAIPELTAWVQDELAAASAGIKPYAAAGARAGLAMTMDAVPEPDWDRDGPFVLRAAHYWGHVGNRQLLYQSEHATVNAGAERALALEAYARAIVYRAVALNWSLGQVIGPEFMAALDAAATFPRWIARHAAAFEHGKIRNVERFVGPAQALGDTANQYFCRCDVLLWEALYATTAHQRKTVLDLSEREKAVADRLWDLARSEQVRRFSGEGLLRYYILGAGVSQRIALMRDMVRHEPVKPEQEVRAQVQYRLARLEREYGMRYELGHQDVLRQTEAYRRAVAAVRH